MSLVKSVLSQDPDSDDDGFEIGGSDESESEFKRLTGQSKEDY